MSNYLAIATVTATLQRTLQQTVQLDVEGARVTTTRPENSGGSQETGISLYLYHIKRNPALGNADMPPRQRRGEMVKRNQLALDLYYLLSFYGNEVELEPQRLLGSAMRTLEDKSVFSAQMIRDTVSDRTFSYLANSDLAEQVEMIRAEFVPISTDELSKVWSVFLQTPYILSVIYKLTVVLIEGEDAGIMSLPVRDRRTTNWQIIKQPTIDLVISATGRYQPILANSTLLIRGRMLANAVTSIRIGGVELTPQFVQDTEINFNLNSVPNEALRAGVQGLQVIHVQVPQIATSRGTRNSNSRENLYQQRIESNVAAFVLRPRIVEVSLLNIEGSDDEPRNATIQVVTDVIIGQMQRVNLILNERTANEPNSYLFAAQKLPNESNNLTFRLRDIKAGEYLVRIQVDGAESILQSDNNPLSPTFEQYINPAILIP
ncbi:hypothetical protein NIES2119_05620 [[Phormidium ambiguum] IAM M-71]|uniref:Pvc16 N-terminal domain-containing protein n=1 Tax=[Phormidium ambiguum] IAM M-71 TaxID=454136 RepID=A0A1U7IQT1_9CYAN|nr:DUF4255 domain-containing protein [Phormidium ambiguum]OKH39729.1 hypothetical protein NIES2119_05620 [Phormidium ambiguum IAM M-71]